VVPEAITRMYGELLSVHAKLNLQGAPGAVHADSSGS
jgi:hypothetical protein